MGFVRFGAKPPESSISNSSGQLIDDWYLEGQMPSRYYSVIRWPLELLIDDSEGFAPKRVKPIGNRGSPVPKNLVQKLTSNSRVAVSLLMFF